MTDKYRRMLLFIMILIVVIIIIDLVFNFRGIFMENYVRYIKSQETFQDTNPVDASTTYTGTPTNENGFPDSQKISPTQHVRSIVSKHNGKIINIEPIDINPKSQNLNFLNDNGQKNDNFDPPKFNIKFAGQSLTVLPDGMVGLRLSNTEENGQQFQIVPVENEETLDALIPAENKGMGESFNETHYPFYILRSLFEEDGTQNKRCLYYDSGKLSVRKIANYDGIKFDISYNPVNVNAEVPMHNTSELLNVLSNDFRPGTGDSPNFTSSDPNKIKINLNLGDDFVSRLLGTGMSSGFSITPDISPSNNLNNTNNSNSQVNNPYNISSRNNSSYSENFSNNSNFLNNTGSDHLSQSNSNTLTYIESDKNRSDYMKQDEYCVNNYIPRNSVPSLCPGCNV